jgi:hypothetical protein
MKLRSIAIMAGVADNHDSPADREPAADTSWAELERAVPSFDSSASTRSSTPLGVLRVTLAEEYNLHPVRGVGDLLCASVDLDLIPQAAGAACSPASFDAAVISGGFPVGWISIGCYRFLQFFALVS